MPVGTGKRNPNIDLGLAVLDVINRPRRPLSYDTIAAACDCSRPTIAAIERRALKKLRARLRENLP